MEEFPIEKLSFTKARISGADGNTSIEIVVEPFDLELDGYSESVDTLIRLDSINLPNKPQQLEGKEFNFPTNPKPGYIDGSIYFFAAHNPVDITRIRFGEISEGRMPLTLESIWVLEYENTGFKNLSKTVETYIEL
ncbi:hypothetical protein D2H34_001954 [Vibrio fluvialis]